jgi:hypothetical protein
MWLSVALGLALLGAQTASATDYWDLNTTDDDDNTGTDNELLHGTSQQHDLQVAGAVADQDWYVAINFPRSSYEALIDSTSGDLNMYSPPTFDRMSSSGTTVVQSAEYANTGSGAGYSVALRWASAGTAIVEQFLRVQSPTCGAACGAEDQYHIRYYETTIAVPRFNNASGQTTVLLIQNMTGWNRPIVGAANFWSTAGAFLGSAGFSIPAHGAFNVNTSTVVPGVTGTITIAHDGGYGGLAVKSVALEPATGFSFDTPGSYKPN